MEENSRPKFSLPSPESSDSLDDSQKPSTTLTTRIIPEKSENVFQKLFFHRFRYFVLILGCLCLTSVSSNMNCFNFTVICFNKKPKNSEFSSNSTNLSPQLYPTYDFSIEDKNMLMYAVAFGTIIGSFPFNYLYTQFGARYVFFGAGIMSAISTILTPLAASMGIEHFLAMRVIQGIAYSADFAAIGVLCVRWASLKQNAFFVSVLTCFTPFSTVITNPVSGALCESKWGWPSVYYTHGFASIILFILWLIFYTDHPATHRAVSEVELEKIHRNKTEAHINMDSFVPYWEICKNPIISTVWLCALTDIVAAVFLMTYTPTYLNKVLHYDIAHAGWLGALPGICHIPFKLVSGYLSDKIKIFGEVKKMIFFNTLALMIPAILYLFLGFVPDELPLLAVFIFTGINTFIGANCAGFYKCGMLVARQYSAFVVANIQFIKCLTLFIAPAMIAIFVQDETSKIQWRNIFFILSAVQILSHTIFCKVVTNEPAEFTKITRKSAQEFKEKKMISIVKVSPTL